MSRRMKPIADEMITAYVDGVLDDLQAAAVEAAMEADPEIAARVSRERRARRERSRAGAEAREAEIIRPDFTKPRPKPAEAPKAKAKTGKAKPFSWIPLAAGATCVVVGMVAAYGFGLIRGGPFDPAPRAGQVAQGALAVALDRKLTGDPGPIAIETTVRDGVGALCRSFRVHGSAGVACRRGAGWDIRMTAQAGSTTPASVRQAVSSLAEGAPLTRAQERAASQAGWR